MPTTLHLILCVDRGALFSAHPIGTGELLTADKISTFLEVGAATESGQPGRVPLNADELKFIKTCGNDPGVGLQLLYFMPRSKLTKDLNVESSYFLFPDDKSVKGSSALFEALLRDLAAKVGAHLDRIQAYI
jgi:hypothetical protein